MQTPYRWSEFMINMTVYNFLPHLYKVNNNTSENHHQDVKVTFNAEHEQNCSVYMLKRQGQEDGLGPTGRASA